MRVSKQQIVSGIGDYIRGEILPKMSDNRAMQIVLSIGVNAALANPKTVDAVLNNSMVRALLADDGTGTYDIDEIAKAMKTAIEEYGSLPVRIPAIPLLSPNEITLHLDANDVTAMRRKIEGTGQEVLNA